MYAVTQQFTDWDLNQQKSIVSEFWRSEAWDEGVVKYVPWNLSRCLLASLSFLEVWQGSLCSLMELQHDCSSLDCVCVFIEYSFSLCREVSSFLKGSIRSNLPLFLKRPPVFWIKGPPYASRTSSDLDNFCKDTFQTVVPLPGDQNTVSFRGYESTQTSVFRFLQTRVLSYEHKNNPGHWAKDIYCARAYSSQLGNDINKWDPEDWTVSRKDRK